MTKAHADLAAMHKRVVRLMAKLGDKRLGRSQAAHIERLRAKGVQRLTISKYKVGRTKKANKATGIGAR